MIYFVVIEEMNKWLTSLCLSLLFLLVASPFTFSITQKFLGSSLGRDGCPTAVGLIIHTIVFMFLVRILLAFKNTTENYVPKIGYTGLASPGSMTTCDTFRLMAERIKSDKCVDAATTCLSNPFDPACHTAIQECDKATPELASYSEMCRIHNFPAWQNGLNTH